MARLRIARLSGKVDNLRAYKVILDGVEVGLIKDGRTLDIDLSPGSHSLHLRVDWCGSPTLQVDGSSDVEITVAAQRDARAGMTKMLFDRMNYVRIVAG